ALLSLNSSKDPISPPLIPPILVPLLFPSPIEATDKTWSDGLPHIRAGYQGQRRPISSGREFLSNDPTIARRANIETIFQPMATAV
ncbi:hypothetical protein PSTG_18882, partial [Puccinia striiformis f. sp. tritici PST-78]